jgi:hypothetical protein
MIETRTSAVSLALALMLIVIPFDGYPWTQEGHEIVALIAEQRLEPEVRDAALNLLEGSSLREAATWADKVRNKQTAPWHYVDIGLNETEYDAAKHCPEDQCIIAQIERFKDRLANTEGDFKKRQKALKYLMHFVADLHQPLHVSDNNDRGGNEVKVEFLGQTINPHNQKSWNLHSVWDSGILETIDPNAHHYAERLNAWLDLQPTGAFQDGSIVDWALESHRVAIEHVYVPPEVRKLGKEYLDANAPIVDQQLAKAGARLAKLLNDALAKK